MDSKFSRVLLLFRDFRKGLNRYCFYGKFLSLSLSLLLLYCYLPFFFYAITSNRLAQAARPIPMRLRSEKLHSNVIYLFLFL